MIAPIRPLMDVISFRNGGRAMFDGMDSFQSENERAAGA
jgi:hypothetical protein